MTQLFFLLFLNPVALVGADFKATLDKHLAAVRNQDYQALMETLPASGGEVSLIMPDGKRTKTVDMFLEMHKSWFSQKGWTMAHEVISMRQSGDMGFALVKADYREADRGGKPYRNVLYVSMVFAREQGRWVMIYDQGTAIKKP